MRHTADQLTARTSLAAVAGPYRVLDDIEGWPVIPGRYGRIEHDGPRLAAYTNRPRLHALLLAVPGVVRHQRGDFELRAWITEAAVPAVARLLMARRRRTGAAVAEAMARARAKVQYRVTSRAALLVGAQS
jgi:hypothetical protein